MRLLRCLALVPIMAVAVAENASVGIQGGVSRLAHEASRELVGEGGSHLDDYGFHLGLSLLAPESTVLGVPSLDIFATRHTGEGSRIDTVGVMYVSRYWLFGLMYVGGGLGTFYDNVRIDRGDHTDRDDAWQPGLKGLVGVGRPSGLFAELDYQYSGKAGDVQTSSANVSVGIRF